MLLNSSLSVLLNVPLQGTRDKDEQICCADALLLCPLNKSVFVNEHLLSLTTMQLGMPHSLQPLAYD